MGRRRTNSRKDPVGITAAVLILLLLAGIVAIQTALSDPAWRARHSLVDILEGAPLAGAGQRS